MLAQLLELWDSLVTAGGEGGSYVRKRLPGAKVIRLYGGKCLANGTEALILEVSTSALPSGLEYPQARGFDLSSETLSPGRKGDTRIVLACNGSRYRPVFHALSSDIATQILGCSEETQAVRILIDRLQRWQAFLQRHRAEGLTTDQQLGLFGELLFFYRHILPRMEPEAAVKAWRGPKGANQDFCFDWGSVEVKSTRSATPRTIHVSNVSQLSDGAVELLLLYVLIVDAGGTAGLGLSTLVEYIRASLTPFAREDFDETLFMVGYLDEQAEAYQEPIYYATRERLFRVDDEFPRIRAESLPPGVESVRFEVALAACSPFEIDLPEFLSKAFGGE